MFGVFRQEKKSIFDEPIQRILNEMETYGPGTSEYSEAIQHLETLHKLKADSSPKRVSADTVWVVAGNLLGILAIVAYEQKHVMTSRAQNFILKPK